MVFVPGPTQSQKLKNKIYRKADKITNSYILLDDPVVGERRDFSIAPYIGEEMVARHARKIKHV